MDQDRQIALGDALVTYWKTLGNETDLPPAGAFKPDKRLKLLLPHIFLLEIDVGDITLSLVGPDHEKRLTVNPMGMSYLDMLPPERHYPTIVRIQAMLQSKCGCRANVDEEMSDGRISPSVLTAVPFAADVARKPCLVAIVPPSTLVEEMGPPKVPFMSRAFHDFKYLDLGFGCPPAANDDLLGIRPASETEVWPDLETLVSNKQS